MGVSFDKVVQETGNDPRIVEPYRLNVNHVAAAGRLAGVDLTHGLIEGGLEVDNSFSMQFAYDAGKVQNTVIEALSWLIVVDAGGSCEAGFFDDKAHRMTNLTLKNYGDWVQKNKPGYGATNLYDAIYTGAKAASKALKAPGIMKLIAKDFFGNYKVRLADLRPVQTDKMYHLTVICDGGSNRGPSPFKEAIKELIVRLSYAGIFIKFIFVGTDSEGREFLQLLDDMPVARHPADLADEGPRDPRYNDVELFVGARYIDNVDKVEFPRGLGSLRPGEFGGAMTQELNTYVPCAVRRGLLTMKNVVLLGG